VVTAGTTIAVHSGVTTWHTDGSVIVTVEKQQLGDHIEQGQQEQKQQYAIMFKVLEEEML
jgi:hypothetical protein